MGNTTIYSDKYPAKMLQYFIDAKESFLSTMDNGKVQAVPARLPTFEWFATRLCKPITCVKVMLDWCKVQPEFAEAYKTCKDIQKELLMHGALSGAYNASAFALIAKNISDFKDKTETEITGGLQIVRLNVPGEKDVGAPLDL
jgi:hypothetical protein